MRICKSWKTFKHNLLRWSAALSSKNYSKPLALLTRGIPAKNTLLGYQTYNSLMPGESLCVVDNIYPRYLLALMMNLSCWGTFCISLSDGLNILKHSVIQKKHSHISHILNVLNSTKMLNVKVRSGVR